MFWEILQKLAELHSTEDVILTPKDGKLSTGHTLEDSKLQVTTIENEYFNCNNFNICSWSYLELPWLMASDVPSHKQVNLTQIQTKCQVDVM